LHLAVRRSWRALLESARGYRNPLVAQNRSEGTRRRDAEGGRALIGGLRPLQNRVYSEIYGSRLTPSTKGWEVLVQHLQRFHRALSAPLADGFERLVELSPGSNQARAVGRVRPGVTAVEPSPVCQAGRRRGAASRC
jgi:hypothetical protein